MIAYQAVLFCLGLPGSRIIISVSKLYHVFWMFSAFSTVHSPHLDSFLKITRVPAMTSNVVTVGPSSNLLTVWHCWELQWEEQRVGEVGRGFSWWGERGLGEDWAPGVWQQHMLSPKLCFWAWNPYTGCSNLHHLNIWCSSKNPHMAKWGVIWNSSSLIS